MSEDATPSETFLTTAAALLATALCASIALFHLRIPYSAIAITLITTIGFTVADSLKSDGRPSDRKWLRRAITSNLIYCTLLTAVLFFSGMLHFAQEIGHGS